MAKPWGETHIFINARPWKRKQRPKTTFSWKPSKHAKGHLTKTQLTTDQRWRFK
jgi:hypothetical protein